MTVGRCLTNALQLRARLRELPTSLIRSTTLALTDVRDWRGLVLMFRTPCVLATIVAVTAGCETVDLRGTLGKTSWQLVQFEGGDGTVLTPDDGSKYTLTFSPDGSFAARIDCNRGSGTWKSEAPSQLELGPMALTRALCPPGSLHDRIVKHLPYVRSYIIKDGHLFLSLMADGGIYEFELRR